MPKASQSQRLLDDEYSKWAVYREIDFLHARLNALLVSILPELKASLPEATWNDISDDEDLLSSLESGKIPLDLKTDYAAGDLDTEAEIIIAINATNSRINLMAAMLNLLFSRAKLEQSNRS